MVLNHVNWQGLELCYKCYSELDLCLCSKKSIKESEKMAIDEALSLAVSDVEAGVREVQTISEFEKRQVKLRTGIAVEKYVVKVRDKNKTAWLLWLNVKDIRKIARYIRDTGKGEVGLNLRLKVVEKEKEDGNISKWIEVEGVE